MINQLSRYDIQIDDLIKTKVGIKNFEKYMNEKADMAYV
jgi:hypothetical protein